MARYLLVRVEDDSRRYDSPFAKVRGAIHELSAREGFPLADFGTDMAFVLESERQEIQQIFERVLRRAKRRQETLEELGVTRKPTRPPEVVPEGYRWVSCAKEVNTTASAHRHLMLVGRGGLTTLCGSTASVPEVWRGNSRKEKCPQCLAKTDGLP